MHLDIHTQTHTSASTLARISYLFAIYSPEMRLHEPGISTPAGKHYDRILVNDDLRLTHRFTGVSRSASLSEVEQAHHRFFPVLPNGRTRPIYRNSNFSDHLPLLYYDPDTNVTFGTWNVHFQLKTQTTLTEYYTKIFKLYDVIAIQEIHTSSELGHSRQRHLDRKWKVSNKLQRERLAFAYDPSKLGEPDCGELAISPRTGPRPERNVFWCIFDVKQVYREDNV